MAMTTNTLVSEFYYRISVLNMHFISFSSTRSVVIPSLFSRKYYITNQNKRVFTNCLSKCNTVKNPFQCFYTEKIREA